MLHLSHLLAPARLAAAVGAVLTVVAAGSSTDQPASRVDADVRAAPVPVSFGDFAPHGEVLVRLACGADLADVRADAAGVAALPPGMLARVPAGRYRLLVSGAGPTGPAPAAGTVLVTVPTTHVVGIRADGTGRTQVDPGAPAPSC